MEVFNNTTKIVKDDLLQKITSGCKISIAAACFSIYAYQELKQELEACQDMRFIFTSPTFVEEKTKKERKEFYISRLKREKSLYGTEFEIRLRNGLKQKAVAKECAAWIQNRVHFKTNTTREAITPFMIVENPKDTYTYTPFKSFSTVDLGCERGNQMSNLVMRVENPESQEYLRTFNEIWNNQDKLKDVTAEVIDTISNAYQENSPELIYFMTLYNIFSEFLDDISEDVLPNEATGFKNSAVWNKLYNFQKDAALGIINKLEQYNGCILADSVGLGKTFTALAVIKYYEGRNKNVLVLCPKKLSENWMTYRSNVVNNPLAADRLRYDVLYHTDLSRKSGMTSIGLPIDRINWGNYDLVVIDESHNFRNGAGTEGKENRYEVLMNRIIKPGVKTKVLMLSATPVNNRFYDLRNQLALAYEGDAGGFSKLLDTDSDVNIIFRQAQVVYNSWSKLPEKERTTQRLLSELSFDFFKVLDCVTIARSRKHIQTYYDMKDIGPFPKRNKPISLRPKLTDIDSAITYNDIYEALSQLRLTIYTPTEFILSSRLKYYVGDDENMKKGREYGIRRLMSINLLKRLESSVCSFSLTLKKITDYLETTSHIIQEFQKGKKVQLDELTDLSSAAEEFDEDDINSDFFTIGRKVKINLEDMDTISWKRDIDHDIAVLQDLRRKIAVITPEHDYKLIQLTGLLQQKITHPINPGNRKVLIFTAFADTAEYLYENLAPLLKKTFGVNTALITGAKRERTSIPDFRPDMNHILTCFSPVSKDRDMIYPQEQDNIDVLIVTDCVSEGQNLQDCDYCINYDIHWNPVRIIQRFGRIDRIGSKNKQIQMVNFWPDLTLDDYINLKQRVETRMKISVMTSTGDDDPINAEEKGDLSYRKNQLKKLQEEVMDLEDMSNGVSIMDLGLNDFRMDLLAYVKEHPEIEHLPFGIHGVVHGEQPGVIFVLKNVNEAVNIDKQNRLHPFYLVYMGMDGQVISSYLQPKDTLDQMRYMAKGKAVPDARACSRFNRMTRDGASMDKVSSLLEDTIDSIIHLKAQEEVESFFSSGETTFSAGLFSGLDDFELICFMVVI